MKNIDKETTTKIIPIVENAKKIVITGHINPDGDAIGASLALFHYLNDQKKTITVIMPNNFPPCFDWMSGSSEIITYSNDKKKANQAIENADIIFSVDYNELSRVEKMGKMIKKSAATKILIDHHPNPDSFADFILSDTSLSSASELMYDFIQELNNNNPLSKTIAECLFTGIMTDTGGFQHNSSKANTYRIVANLIDFGVNKEEITDNVYNNFSEDRMHFIGYALDQKMTVLPEFNTAYLAITKEEQERYNYENGDSEGLVNFPLSIKNIAFSVLFIEKEDCIKASFRSKGTFNTNQFARNHFNGGGHRNASGGKNYDSMKSTIEFFIENLHAHKEELQIQES